MSVSATLDRAILPLQKETIRRCFVAQQDQLRRFPEAMCQGLRLARIGRTTPFLRRNRRELIELLQAPDVLLYRRTVVVTAVAGFELLRKAVEPPRLRLTTWLLATEAFGVRAARVHVTIL